MAKLAEHSYRLVDRPGIFHTEWSGDRGQTALDGSAAVQQPVSQPITRESASR